MNFKKPYWALFVLLFVLTIGQAQQISPELSKKVAKSFLLTQGKNTDISSVNLIVSEMKAVARIYNLVEGGYVIIPADRQSIPVLAYSFRGRYNDKKEVWRYVEHYIIEITGVYQKYQNLLVQDVQRAWGSILECGRSGSFEQWPPEGTTSTGGWLETNWKQSSPYNMMCPMDLNTGNRSIAGCPAVAMAQIVNFHEETHEIQFDDNDDYYHSFGSGNQYWIDNDHEARDFPSYPELNLFMDAIQDNYDLGVPPTDEQIAALNFACGVACKQVYSSSISGTYGIEQAFNAYNRFHYDSVKLIYDTDTNINLKLALNMKNAMPAHLGLINPEGNAGHNLVVDGYNTDEYFHFNFGWGGSANGWYTMPPTGIPYNLTIIEGLIIDINRENIHVSAPEDAVGQVQFYLYPNPSSDWACISSNGLSGIDHILIYDARGNQMDVSGFPEKDSHAIRIDLSGFERGLYLVQIMGRGELLGVRKLMVQ